MRMHHCCDAKEEGTYCTGASEARLRVRDACDGRQWSPCLLTQACRWLPGVVVGWRAMVGQASAAVAALTGRPAAWAILLPLHNCASEPASRVPLAASRADRCRLVRPSEQTPQLAVPWIFPVT